MSLGEGGMGLWTREAVTETLGCGSQRPGQEVGADLGSGKPATACLTRRVPPQVELKSQEAQGLQQQRDQCLGHLQQYLAAYQQLAADRDALQQQVLAHSQLLERRQQEEAQGQEEARRARQELQEAQVRQLGRWDP